MSTVSDRLQAILHGPALAAPKNSKDVHQPGNSHLLFIMLSICMTVSGIATIIRLYTQLSLHKRLDLADYFLTLGYAVAIGVTVVSTIAVSQGWGSHQWTITMKQFFDVLYYINVLEAMYGPLIFCVKMAIIFQYLSMFAPHRVVSPFVYYGSWLIISTCVIFYSTTTLLTVFACAPRQKIWNKLYVGGQCMNYRAIIVSTAIFNIASDFAILLLPVRTVWKLQIPTRKKLAISLLFGTGLSACIASAMRGYYTLRIMTGGANADISFESVFTAVWSYTECALGIVVACSLSVPKLIHAKKLKIHVFFSDLTSRFTLRSKSHSLASLPDHDTPLSTVSPRP